jgi:hypothetical protein
LATRSGVTFAPKDLLAERMQARRRDTQQAAGSGHHSVA